MEQKDLQVFNFETQQVRVVLIDGEPWWVARDVCEILGLNNVSMALERLEEDEKLTSKILMSGQNRDVGMINESGLYSLILRSNKPYAKKFRKWVTSEVLPSIRKHGTYMTPQKIKETALSPDMLTTLVQALNEKQEALKEEQEKVSELELLIEDQQSKVTFAKSLQDDLLNQNTILIGGFRKIICEDNMLFVWLHPSSSVKGIAPLSVTIDKDSEPSCLRLTYEDTQ